MKTTIKMQYEQRRNGIHSVDKKGTKFDLLTDIKSVANKKILFGCLF